MRKDRLFSLIIYLMIFTVIVSFGCGGSSSSGGDTPGSDSSDNNASDSSWIKTIGGTGYDEGNDVAVDGSGNIYIAGTSYSYYFDFNPDAGIDVHGNTTGIMLFVTKLENDGTYLWTKTINGEFGDPASIAVDKNNNIYVCCTFDDAVDFNPGDEVDTHTSLGGPDLSLTKLESDGSYAWTKTIGSDEDSEYFLGPKVETDADGNIFITGAYEGTMDFDIGDSADNYTSAGEEIFLTKINNDGSYSWTKTMSTTVENVYYDFDEAFGLAVDGSGNIYLTGYFSGTVDFNPDEEEKDLHSSAGYGDIFVTKILSDGTYGWTKTMEGEGYDFGYAITVDGNSNIYITGTQGGDIDFDPGEGTDYFSTDGFFITKLLSDGSYGWTKSGGYAWAYSNAIDASGNIYITGEFSGTEDFDPEDSEDIHTSFGYEDIFLTKIASDGSYEWTKTMGSGTEDDAGNSVAVDGSGNVFLTGSFCGTVDFDWSDDTDNRTSGGAADIFFIKFVE